MCGIKLPAESLVGASVYDVNSLSGVATNAYGFFSLSLSVLPGSNGIPVRLQVSYIGYESRSFTLLALQQDTVLAIDLQPNAAIGEVLVTASETIRQTVRNTQMGALEINHATIRATPTLLGEADIIRTLQLTPGVSSGTGRYFRFVCQRWQFGWKSFPDRRKSGLSGEPYRGLFLRVQ